MKRRRRQGWVDAVFWPAFEFATKRVVAPASVAWLLYEVTGAYMNHDEEQRDELLRQKNALTVAALSTAAAVGLVGGTMLWATRRR